MRIIREYLRSMKKECFLFAAFVAIFGIIFYLYNLPAEPYLYGTTIIVCIGILYFCVQGRTFFVEWKEKEKQEELHHFLTEQMERSLMQEKERKEYYTLWVHQIKTPIAAMRLMLQDEESPDRGDLSMELFEIEQYVEMALQFVRMQSMSEDIMIRKYSLDAVVRQAVRKYARLFIGRKLKLIYEPCEKEILTDEKWMVFVIEQILSNAVKYTKSGSVHIYCNEAGILVIEDTGIGISKEDLPRVFEKGFTGLNGRMDKKSTGIGLYLCRQILTQLSHEIMLESEPGKGTKVMIAFPETDLHIQSYKNVMFEREM